MVRHKRYREKEKGISIGAWKITFCRNTSSGVASRRKGGTVPLTAKKKLPNYKTGKRGKIRKKRKIWEEKATIGKVL